MVFTGSVPKSCPQPGVLPPRVSSACRSHSPHYPPQPCPAACLTCPVPGCQEPLHLGHGYECRGRPLAPATQELLSQSRPRALSFPRPCCLQLQQGEEATRNWLFESAPQPIVLAPAPLPSLGKDSGGTVALHSPSHIHPPSRQVTQECTSLHMHPSCSTWRRMLEPGQAGLPELDRITEPKHPPAVAGAPFESGG